MSFRIFTVKGVGRGDGGGGMGGAAVDPLCGAMLCRNDVGVGCDGVKVG